MRPRIRCFLSAALLALPEMHGLALAQGYPTKPFRFLLPCTPGGKTDTLLRRLAQRLSEILGQLVVIATDDRHT